MRRSSSRRKSALLHGKIRARIESTQLGADELGA
jgi:hypothetical protein